MLNSWLYIIIHVYIRTLNPYFIAINISFVVNTFYKCTISRLECIYDAFRNKYLNHFFVNIIHQPQSTNRLVVLEPVLNGTALSGHLNLTAGNSIIKISQYEI